MRSSNFVFLIITAFLTFFMLVTFCGGCSDSPENEARKYLQEQIDRALAISEDGNAKGGYEVLSAAIYSSRGVGGIRESALMAAGGLALEAANDSKSKLGEHRRQINDIIFQMLSQGRIASKKQTESGQTQVMVEKITTNQQGYRAILEGDITKKGLKEQLAENREKLANLEEKRDALEEDFEDIEAEANMLATKAKEVKDSLAGLSGEETGKAIDRRVELLEQRNDKLVELGELENELMVVDDDIELVSAMVEEYENKIEKISGIIEDIENSGVERELSSTASGYRSELDDAVSEINRLASELNDAVGMYSDALGESMELYSAAAKEYEQVRGRDNRLLAEMGKASSYFNAAFTGAKGSEFLTGVAGSARDVQTILGERRLEALSDIESRCRKLGQDYLGESAKNYSSSAGSFEELMGMRLDAEQECDITKKLLISRFNLDILYAAGAERVSSGNEEGGFRQGQEPMSIEELIEKAKNCDPDFDKSLAARLISGELSYVPSVEVDPEIYYTQLKEQFQGWQSLQGEEKKSRINELLVELEEISPPEGSPEYAVYNNILGPVRDSLEAELEAIESGPDPFDMADEDPNYF